MKRDICSDAAGVPTALGPLLVLPQNFGNIFLGETFSSYISVHNDSPSPVTGVNVKVRRGKGGSGGGQMARRRERRKMEMIEIMMVI